MNTKVFISYSGIDEDFAKKIAQKLDEIGISYFFDCKDIGKGIDWGRSITETPKELSECLAVVVVISPTSLKAQWVPLEIGYAIGAGKKIVLFLTHPSLKIPGYLQDLHYMTRLKDVKEYFQRLFESSPETREEEIKSFAGAEAWGRDWLQQARDLRAQIYTRLGGFAGDSVKEIREMREARVRGER